MTKKNNIPQNRSMLYNISKCLFYLIFFLKIAPKMKDTIARIELIKISGSINVV